MCANAQILPVKGRGDVYEKKMDSSVDDNADSFDAWYCIMRKSDHL